MWKLQREKSCRSKRRSIERLLFCYKEKVKVSSKNDTIKQIVTPPNYQARGAEQKVSIVENNQKNVVLENIPLIEVSDTGRTISNIIVIGIIISLIGCAVILMTIRETKEAK